MMLLGISNPMLAAEPPAPPQAAPAAPELKDARQRASYALGVGIARKMKSDGLDGLDLDLLRRGMQDMIVDGKSVLTDAELNSVLREYVTEAREKLSAENRKKGEEFLAANKAKPGVQTTASGLQYRVLKQGTGATPKASDRVKTHYKGTFIDGKEFDSSIGRGQPAEFPVTGVIKGWTEALQLMKVGDKWELVIPSDLAYGPEGRPGIPPHSTLVFEIELLDIPK
jgi:FKBP-type peptidyl-prolyl cis-trans isomerase